MRRLVAIKRHILALGFGASIAIGTELPARVGDAAEAPSVGVLPPHPYEKLPGDGYARFIFGANAPGNLVVEVRNIFIKPGGQSQLPVLPGPGILEVKNGRGTISPDQPSAMLIPGQPTTLKMREQITLHNTGGQPLILQLYLFEAK